MSNKHLTYDDRLTIQAGLQQGLKIAQIAKNIGKDRSTVGREIKAHRRLVATSKGNNCIHHRNCTRIPNCRSVNILVREYRCSGGTDTANPAAGNRCSGTGIPHLLNCLLPASLLA